MEVVISIAIGVMASAGVWLVLRPRTFQVLIGLTLLSYANPSSRWAWRPTSSTTATRCRSRWC
jgi:hypothetical protein